VGHVLSGEGSFVLAAVPDAPSPPANEAAVTDDQRIKVTFGEPLPNARGSPIVGLQLAVDDGAGGEFRTVVGEDEAQATLATAYILEGAEKGKSYRFRCRVQNSIGWSSWSSPDTYIIAAVVGGFGAASAIVGGTIADGLSDRFSNIMFAALLVFVAITQLLSLRSTPAVGAIRPNPPIE